MLDFLFTLASLLAIVGLAHGAFLCARFRRIDVQLRADLASTGRTWLPHSDWDLLPRAWGDCKPSTVNSPKSAA